MMIWYQVLVENKLAKFDHVDLLSLIMLFWYKVLNEHKPAKFDHVDLVSSFS